MTKFTDSERRWDERAGSYNSQYIKSKETMPDDIVRYIDANSKLKDSTILDVGGGTGRYAIPFCKSGAKVTICDFSSNMLKHAKENCDECGVDDIQFVKGNWEYDSIQQLKFEKAFDYAFASMCPPIREIKGIEKMIACARKGCFINQFIVFEDDLDRYLKNELGIKKDYDPHEDRETVRNTFNYLWDGNYNPKIVYFSESTESEMNREDASAKLERKYGELLREKGISIDKILDDMKITDSFINNSNKTSALISWEV